MADSLSVVAVDVLAVLRAGPQDTGWSSYDSGAQLIEAVAGLVGALDAQDADAVRELRLLFAPTGALQETAMSSGWHDTYMALAERVDALVK